MREVRKVCENESLLLSAIGSMIAPHEEKRRYWKSCFLDKTILEISSLKHPFAFRRRRTISVTQICFSSSLAAFLDDIFYDKLFSFYNFHIVTLASGLLVADCTRLSTMYERTWQKDSRS